LLHHDLLIKDQLVVTVAEGRTQADDDVDPEAEVEEVVDDLQCRWSVDSE
jgi:hypothetical protein